MYMMSSSASFTGCSFDNNAVSTDARVSNTVDVQGGMVFLRASSAHFAACSFSNFVLSAPRQTTIYGGFLRCYRESIAGLSGCSFNNSVVACQFKVSRPNAVKCGRKCVVPCDRLPARASHPSSSTFCSFDVGGWRPLLHWNQSLQGQRPLDIPV